MAERRRAMDGPYGGHPKLLTRLGFSGIDEEHHKTVGTTSPGHLHFVNTLVAIFFILVILNKS